MYLLPAHLLSLAHILFVEKLKILILGAIIPQLRRYWILGVRKGVFMEATMITATVIFVISIFLVITGIIDTVIAAFLGVFAMIAFSVMTDLQAFQVVDWNVIFILIGIWIIAGYLGKTGLPEYLAAKLLILSKGSVPLFITLITSK